MTIADFEVQDEKLLLLILDKMKEINEEKKLFIKKREYSKNGK